MASTRTTTPSLFIREQHTLCSAYPGKESANPTKTHNLLFSGDNLALLQALDSQQGRQVLGERGGLKLIYSDPPFNVGSDFICKTSFFIPEGPPRSIDLVAYSDMWQGNSYYTMLYERLQVMHRLLDTDGTLFLHCDWRTSAMLRLLLDSVFGPECFLGEIIWHYTGGGRSTRYFSRKHDTIFHYAKSDKWTFNIDAIRVPYKEGSGYAKSGIVSKKGKKYSPNPLGTPADDVWDIPIVNPMSYERLPYPTQKPEVLLERILLACSNEGDLVADFFCGSGTTLAVAQKHGRAWIGADQSPIAIATTQHRLAQQQEARVQNEQAAPAPYLLLGSQPYTASRESQHLARADALPAIECTLEHQEEGVCVRLTDFHPALPEEPVEQDAGLPSKGLSWIDGWGVSWGAGTGQYGTGRSAKKTSSTVTTFSSWLHHDISCFVPCWFTWRSWKNGELLFACPVVPVPQNLPRHITVQVIDVLGQRYVRTLVLQEEPCNTVQRGRIHTDIVFS